MEGGWGYWVGEGEGKGVAGRCYMDAAAGKSERTASHHGALGGGEVDGVDARGQSLLQVQQDVGADARAGHGALGGRGLVQELLEAVQFDQQHHVLQEVALDESCELRGPEELWVKQNSHTFLFHILLL